MNKKYYGIVEGFFSDPLKPWTMSQRKEILKFILTYAPGINTYLYCPKDDPYVTQRWDRMYNAKGKKDLKDFIRQCTLNKITFFYGFNPSVTNMNSWEKIAQKTNKKIDQLTGLGCKNVCLLFDDIPAAYDALDDSLTEEDFYLNVIQLINTIFLKYKNILDDFWVCLPDYIFIKSNILTKAAKNLDRKIGIIWSGNQVFSKEIVLTDIQRIQRILFPNVRLIYWSNYPVNDAEQAEGNFNLGGFYPIPKNAYQSLSGILVNPMREVYATLPFYMTYSDCAINRQKYNRDISWRNACNTIGLSANEIFLIKVFSSVNALDTVKKDINPSNIPYKRFSLESNSVWKKRFNLSIKKLYKDAVVFIRISKAIKENKKVTMKLFLQFDWFPTKVYIARYFPEIIAIVQCRFNIYKEYAAIPRKNNQNELLSYFNKNYLGQKKLTISKKDNAVFLKEILHAIASERTLFLNLLNNPGITSKKKIELLYKRRHVNRFTIC